MTARLRKGHPEAVFSAQPVNPSDAAALPSINQKRGGFPHARRATGKPSPVSCHPFGAWRPDFPSLWDVDFIA